MEYVLHGVVSGRQAARKANDVLGIFTEREVDGGRRSHSYHVPATPAPGPSTPSYFADLTKHLPKQANPVRVQNLRPEQVPVSCILPSAQDYLGLARQGRQSGRLWEDSAFPADNRVLTEGNMIVSYFGRKQVRDSDIRWLRPGEICQGEQPGRP
jgi:hypothetical protein